MISEYFPMDSRLNTEVRFHLFPVGILIQTMWRFSHVSSCVHTVWCHINMIRFEAAYVQKIFRRLIKA